MAAQYGASSLIHANTYTITKSTTNAALRTLVSRVNTRILAQEFFSTHNSCAHALFLSPVYMLIYISSFFYYSMLFYAKEKNIKNPSYNRYNLIFDYRKMFLIIEIKFCESITVKLIYIRLQSILIKTLIKIKRYHVRRKFSKTTKLKKWTVEHSIGYIANLTSCGFCRDTKCNRVYCSSFHPHEERLIA